MPSEYDDAIKLANTVLDKPFIDPDGDICLLARQFLRLVDKSSANELNDEMVEAARECYRDLVNGTGIASEDMRAILTAALSIPVPACAYCGSEVELRVKCTGCGRIAPEYTCEDCFTPRDDGPCFDDLPEA